MIHLRDQTCQGCHKTKLMNVRKIYCADCTVKGFNNDHKEHFDNLDKLTLEERIRKIEEWQHNFSKKYLYDQNPKGLV
jgi:hypothetical protein